jgi:hypothetical protein
MHPNKFLGRAAKAAGPAMSDMERAERLDSLGAVIAGKRKEAVDARKASGIEDTWLACEEAYLGIDDANRHEFAKARWAKPVSMNGGLTANTTGTDPTRSSAFVRLTSRYVDQASAKLGEILFPIDDKAFSFDPTPDPDLIKKLKDDTPLAANDGQPVVKPAEAPPAAPGQMPAMTPAAQGAQQMVQATTADAAQRIIDQAADCAKRAETRIYDWMVEAKYPAEGRKVIHDAARIGAGVLKGPFPDVQRNRALTTTPNGVELSFVQKVVPSVKWIDPWNLFPGEGCGENIHDGEDLFERDFLSTKALRKLSKQKNLGYLPEQIDKVIEEGPDKCNTDGSNPSAHKSKNRFTIWYYYGALKREDMALANAVGIDDLPDDVEEVSAIVSLVNDTVIRAIINPLDSGAFPYRVVSWSRRPGHWAGEGVAEKMAMPQRAVNASTRAMFNNAGVASGVQIVLNQASIVPADGKWVITPNKLWYATGDAADVAKAFALFEIPNIQQQLQAIIEYGMKLAEEQTGIPLVTQGQTGQTSPETFGQAELQNDNAHTWLRSIGKRYDDQITEPLVEDFYEWLLLDPGVPNDEKGDYRINAQGSSAMIERAVQEQVLLGLLNAAANPAFRADPAKVFALYLKAKRINPRDVQYSEEQQKKMDAQPAPPPVQVMVEQVRGQNALQKVQAEAQTEAELQQQELAHEQQMLQNGGVQPHQAAAMAQIERERIRSQTAQVVEASRAHAESSRADKEMLIAQQNGEFKLRELELKRELALLQYAQDNKTTLEDAKVQLADRAMQEHTRRQLAAAEIQLAASEGAQDRQHDMHKHATSLVRDEISTENTP